MAYRVVFMGTPEFALASLEALVEHPDFDVVLVVTQPDRPVGRKRVLTPPPVKQLALKHGISVLQPEKVGSAEAMDVLQDVAADVFITAAFGQLLPQRVLDLPSKGCLNVHASLLPRWRGAAPIHRAIMAGDVKTGVTIMEMVRALDAGPIVGVIEVDIQPDDNMSTLHDKLARAGADELIRVLPSYLDGTIQPTPQPQEGVTYAERILRADEFVDWALPSRLVRNHIRGLSAWPGASTRLFGDTLKVLEVYQTTSQEVGDVGEVKWIEPYGPCVRTGDGWLQLSKVQPSGKRLMAAEEWYRGVQQKGPLQFEVTCS